MAPASKVTLYFDIVSPFAYEAFHILKYNDAFKDVEVTLVPIFLGGLMNLCGNAPPITIKNKDIWIQRERLRWAQLFSVPMHKDVVPNFPPNTMKCMRALSLIPSSSSASTNLLSSLVEKLYTAFFVDLKPIEKPSTYGPILAEVLGKEEAERILAQADAEGKGVLKENTDQAFKDGAFGAPWFVCENKDGARDTFWGVDHIGQMADFLGVKRPATGGWKAML